MTGPYSKNFVVYTLGFKIYRSAWEKYYREKYSKIEKSKEGAIEKTLFYNKQGQVQKSIVRVGNDVRTTEYLYDMYGNIIETSQPDGTTIKIAYNVKGQKISETNQLFQTRYFEYDDNGQLVKVILPDGATYKYAYDVQGNQTSIIDPLNRETKFTYDDNGNQLTRTLPDGSTEYFEYDYKGRLIKQISFEGVETIFKYDEFERLTSKTFSVNGITETWTYTYDQYGRVSEIDQNGRIVKTTYDSQGRTKSIETPEGIISYTYDEFGRQTSVQTDNDPPTIYSYDNYGRLSSVTSDGKTTKYEYDSFGNLAKTTLPNGVITTYEYDNMNRLIKETNYVDKNQNGKFDESQGEGIAQFEYGLDAQGRKISAIEKFWKDINNDDVIDELFNDIKWTYDDDGRLVKEVFDHYDDNFDQTLLFDYDQVSNRTLQKVDKGNDGTIDEVTKYTYDENDRLLTELHDAQNDGVFEKTTTYGYDHTQQTSKTVHVDGTKINETTYQYNLQGRMAVVTITTFNEDGTVARNDRTTYNYDESGIRISALHEVDSDGDGVVDKMTLTEYLNDPLNITGYSQVLKQTETDLKTGEITITTYVIGHQRISQTVEKNGVKTEYYFTFDGHGSTRALTDFIGTIVELYSYDAFGNALGFDPSTALTEFLYSGEQFDSKINQQYLRQRYYDPTTGRFNRLDPFFGNLNDPLSLHKYLYTHGDPINMIDPSGLLGSFGVSIATALGTGLQIAVSHPLLTLGAGGGIFAFGVAKLLNYTTSQSAWIGISVASMIASGIYIGGLSGIVRTLGIAGETLLGSSTVIFALLNLHGTFYNPTRANEQADKFFERFDEIYGAHSKREDVEKVKNVLNTLFNTSRQIRPDTFYFCDLVWSAQNFWMGNGPTASFCGDWIDRVIKNFRDENIRYAKSSFNAIGVDLYVTQWKQLGGNKHFTITIKLTYTENGKQNVEYWHIDNGWFHSTVGGPFEKKAQIGNGETEAEAKIDWYTDPIPDEKIF